MLPLAAAAADGDFDFLGGAVELAAGFDDHDHIAGPRHLDAVGNEGTVPAGILYDATSATGFSLTRNEIEVTSASEVVTDTGTTAPFSAISGASSLTLSEAPAVLP